MLLNVVKNVPSSLNSPVITKDTKKVTSDINSNQTSQMMFQTISGGTSNGFFNYRPTGASPAALR